MSWHPAPPRTPAPWWVTIRAMFTSDRTISSEGAGHNLVEILAELVRSLDGVAHEIRRYNDRRDKQDGE